MPAKDVEVRRATARAWYQRNKQLRSGADRARRQATRDARQRVIEAWYAELKRTARCSDCDEDHPACIQFHHTNASAKAISIADAVRRGWSTQRIEHELAKCVVLCANCHAKRHARLGRHG